MTTELKATDHPAVVMHRTHEGRLTDMNSVTGVGLGLRGTVLVVLMAVGLTLGLGMWLLMRDSIHASFSKLETDDAVENATRASNLIAERCTQLASQAGDWGAWDDTYAYVQDLNADYASANLTADALARIRIQYVLYVDEHAAVKSSFGVDLAAGESAPVPAELLDRDWSDLGLVEAPLETKHAGVVMVASKPMLMGASQILKSDGAGPVRGMIIALRSLDETELASLSEALRVPVSLAPAASVAGGVRCEIRSENEVTAIFPLVDFLGHVELEGHCTLDRRIMAQGRATLQAATGNVAAMVAAFSFVVYLVLGRFVIGRLVRMASEVAGLATDGTACGRVSDRGRDEIGALASRFNMMLGSIETSHASLNNQNALLAAARASAEAANDAKSRFLANMSHEIRTPLTAILGFADLLRENDIAAMVPGQRLAAIDTIHSAGQHLLTVINDILDMSKIEADRMTVEKIDTSLVAVLCEVESLMRPRALQRGVALAVTLATPVPERIMGDPTRLRQILLNLVGNAVKFTEAGSISLAARVQAHDGQRRLVFDVADTGPGMTPAQAAKLFQAFGQADDTVARRHGGSGLGLVISRRLAELMGGSLTLVDTQPGKGSHFRVELPLDAVTGAATITSLDAGGQQRHEIAGSSDGQLAGRILLAEDGVDNQRLISFHLRKAGATVEIAENGRIALDMIERADAAATPYDLLLTDMQMPEMDGYTLTRVLRRRGSTLAIIALTAHAMAEDRARCIEAGCDDYATKPIERAALLAKCAAWINKTGGVNAAARAA